MSTGRWKDHKYLYTKSVTTKDGNHYVRYYYEISDKKGKKSRVSYVNTLSEEQTETERRMNDMIDKANAEGGDRRRGLSNYDLMDIEEAHQSLKSGHIAKTLVRKLTSGDAEGAINSAKYWGETFGKELMGNIRGGLNDAKGFVDGLLKSSK